MQLDRVVDELRMVRDVLDEFHAEFQWAVQVGRIRFVHGEDVSSGNKVRLTLLYEGGAVDVEYNRLRGFGEVPGVDDAANLPTVLLIPSNKKVTVPQDSSRKVERRGSFEYDNLPAASKHCVVRYHS